MKWNASCSNAVYTPPTLTPPTTPSPDEMQRICRAASDKYPSKRFFFTYADSSCRTYVYCERNSISSYIFETTLTGSCSSPNIYFNTISGKCQGTLPDSCRADAVSTTTESRLSQTSTTVFTTQGITQQTTEETTAQTTAETTEQTTEATTEQTETDR